MNLDLYPINKIEFVYCELDANAISFQLPSPNSYFSIQTDAFIDHEDLETDVSICKPWFELDDQINSKVNGLESVLFDRNSIMIFFEENEFFLEKYKTITIHLNEAVTREIVDFFSNHLFLGNYIQYTEDFDENLKVLQTEYPEEI